MRTLAKIKEDLDFNKGLSSLVETLKTIAVSQYRALETKIETYEDFIRAIDGFFENLDITKINHAFLNSKNKTQFVVAITSDSGFLGGLNMQVMNAAFSELAKNSGRLAIIGERGKIYGRGSDMSFVSFPGISDEQRYGQAMQLRDYIVDKVLSGAFGRVTVVYPRPVSFTVQSVHSFQLLPYSPLKKDASASNDVRDVIMESGSDDITEYLVYLWMGQKIYDIFWLSRLAEFAARYIHLEGSLQKLKDIDKKVKQEYFRIRHELIDRTMRELFAARAIYAK
ncbi:MAG TPA: F0F1 ATP synthase subunit gamma [Candidatus Omnitrophica bacterium]|nr:F0F1 ATP synthase subunit gamma [Candidatus Omnitrophota bacterium]